MLMLMMMMLTLFASRNNGCLIDKQSQAHIELDCGERSNLSGVPQCQPSVHEGHEGKSDDNFANGDNFENDCTIAMIIFWLPAQTVSKDGHKGKIANPVGRESEKGKFQRFKLLLSTLNNFEFPAQHILRSAPPLPSLSRKNPDLT